MGTESSSIGFKVLAGELYEMKFSDREWCFGGINYILESERVKKPDVVDVVVNNDEIVGRATGTLKSWIRKQ